MCAIGDIIFTMSHASWVAFRKAWVSTALSFFGLGIITRFGGCSAQPRGLAGPVPFLTLFLSLVAVVSIDLLVLWALQRWIRPSGSSPQADKASFQAKFKGFGSAITATAGGVLGSFLTILPALLGALFVLSKLA